MNQDINAPIQCYSRDRDGNEHGCGVTIINPIKNGYWDNGGVLCSTCGPEVLNIRAGGRLYMKMSEAVATVQGAA